MQRHRLILAALAASLALAGCGSKSDSAQQMPTPQVTVSTPLVQDVVDGSPAEKADLRAGDDKISFQGQTNIVVGGDLIVGVDDTSLTREHDLADEISAHSAGDRVRLTILRDGERRTVAVELGKRPAGNGP